MTTQDDSYFLLCQNLSVPGTSIVSKLSPIETIAWVSSQLDSPVIQQAVFKLPQTPQRPHLDAAGEPIVSPNRRPFDRLEPQKTMLHGAAG